MLNLKMYVNVVHYLLQNVLRSLLLTNYVFVTLPMSTQVKSNQFYLYTVAQYHKTTNLGQNSLEQIDVGISLLFI